MDAGHVEYCHGTLIVHALLRSDCTEDNCTTPELMGHAFVIDCDTVGCECAQPMGSADVFASSTASTSGSG
jgi:hypothetical protein